MPPQDLDVNVHPTKKEVHFLHEEELLEILHARLSTALRSANDSRSFQVQTTLRFDAPPTVPVSAPVPVLVDGVLPKIPAAVQAPSQISLKSSKSFSSLQYHETSVTQRGKNDNNDRESEDEVEAEDAEEGEAREKEVEEEEEAEFDFDSALSLMTVNSTSGGTTITM